MVYRIVVRRDVFRDTDVWRKAVYRDADEVWVTGVENDGTWEPGQDSDSFSPYESDHTFLGEEVNRNDSHCENNYSQRDGKDNGYVSYCEDSCTGSGFEFACRESNCGYGF